MVDALDVLTAAEARAAVGKDGIDEDEGLLAQMTTGVSRSLDRAVGPVVQRVVTGELHDGGSSTVQLALYPVSTLTLVTEHTSGVAAALTVETPTTMPNGYLAEPYRPDPALLSGLLVRRSGGSDTSWAGGRRNVKVTYVAGRSADTASVDARFKHAARIWLQYMWRAEEPSVAVLGEFDVPAQAWPKFGVPNAVRDMLLDVWQLGTPATTYAD